MTSSARLFLSVLLATTAFLMGAFSALGRPDAPLETNARDWSAITIPDADDIDEFVARISAAGLFPEATLRTPDSTGEGAAGPSVDTLEVALYTPNLSAFVRRSGDWRLYLYGEQDGAAVFREGDRLADGWVISTIAPTHIILTREGEVRRLDAFRPEGNSNE
ncbi:SctD/MshK family protein [Maricaulis sp. CAU 1757]